MNIGLDVDGVIADFFSQAILQAYWLFDKAVNPLRYDLGLTSTEHRILEMTMIECGLFRELPIYEQTEYHTRSIYKDNTIYYISCRGKGMVKRLRRRVYVDTFHWLLQYDFPFVRNIHLVQDKADICRKLNIDILIEDCLETAQKLNGKDLRVLLIDRPWNQGDYQHRIESILEVKRLC